MEQTKEQPWIAICTPTRGMLFSRVAEYIENVRSTYPNIRWFTTHNQPIPDCFNSLAGNVLEDLKYQYVWWIEEDVIPPDLALDAFLQAMNTSDIAAIDYGFNGNWNTIVRSAKDQKILFTGFGCTFMKRAVLESFEKPIFKADKAFNISSMQWYGVDPMKVYGMYDIRFGSEAREKGFVFEQVAGECTHLQLMQLGAREINNGCHVIGVKGTIERQLTLPIENL